MITSSSFINASFASSPWVRNATVFVFSCNLPFSSILFITPVTPPALYKSSIKCSPDGDNLQICGVFLAISLKSFNVKSTPASYAIAGKCNAVFEDPPNAISTATAFSNASFVIMSSGLKSAFKTSIICIPAFLASLALSENTAGTVPFPGSPIPSASVKQFIVFAVYIPEQEPQVGQAISSTEFNSFLVIFPVLYSPTASKTLLRPIFLPLYTPASIAPPLINIAGIFNLAAAINIPGTTLSQLGINTIASNGVAIATASIESAIIFLVTSEYFIPIWFIASPSQIPIVLNSIGTPPAFLIPSFTDCTKFFKWTCPGIISLNELAIPIIGFSISSLVNPNPFNSDLCGALAAPFVKLLLLSFPFIVIDFTLLKIFMFHYFSYIYFNKSSLSLFYQPQNYLIKYQNSLIPI